MAFDFTKDFPSSKDASKDTSSINTIELDGQKYLFALFMDNGDQVIQVPHKYLNTLHLNDSLIENKTEGRLTYRDPNFSIGRLISKLNSMIGEGCIKQDEEDEDKATDFNFRGSGNEKLHLKLMPIVSDDESDILDLSKRFSKGEWIIQQTFIIKSIKNSLSKLSSKEYEVKFEDIVTHVVNNYRISEFPTSIVGRTPLNDEVKSETPTEYKKLDAYPSGDGSGKGDFTAAQTGEAIYWIIHRAFKEYREKTNFDITGYLPAIDYTGGHFVLEQDELTSRKKTWIKKGDYYEQVKGDLSPEDVWDFGPNESILHTSLEGRTTNHILRKFINVHVSGVEHEESEFLDPDKKSLSNLNWGPCILHLKRPENEDELPTINLRPIYSWMNNMGQVGGDTIGMEFMDTFLFKNEETYTEKGLGVVKAFANAVNICSDLDGKLTQASTPIDEFVYDPMNPSDSAKFIVPHISEYNRPPNMEYAELDGSFDFCKKFISELYVPFFTKQSDPENRFNMVNINDDDNVKDGDAKIRIQNLTPTKPAMVALGRNKLIKNMIFMNDLLSFKLQGSTHRQSGRFFGVDLIDGSDPNDEKLNRLLGAWWGVNVTHEIDFRDKTYVNEVTGVKFYRYRPLEGGSIVPEGDTDASQFSLNDINLA